MKKSDYNAVLKGGYAAAIFLTVLVFVILAICNGVYPFGDNSFLVYDGNDQYLNFYGYLQDIQSTGNNLFYSFNKVLGGNMFSTSAYYMFSPFNLLLPIFGKEHLLFGVHFVILIKHIFAAAAFCFCLNYFEKEGTVGKVVLSVCYSYMGYVVTFFMIPEWFDGIVLLPILTVGIHKIIKESSPVLYIVCLTLAIVSNYYIGFMLCVVSVIFYIVLLVLYEEAFVKCLKDTISMFGISSLLSGGMSAVVLLPVIKALPKERIQTDIKELLDFKFDFKFSELLFQLFGYGTGAEQIRDGLPLLFAGSISVLLVILFFFNKGIGYKEKITAFLLLLFFAFSFQNSLLNRMWHGMSNNAEFNYRYSFLFSFILLITAFISLSRLGTLEKSDFCKAGIVLLAGMLWIFDHFDEKAGNIPAAVPCFDLCMLGLALIVLAMCSRKNENKRFFLLFGILAILNITEIGVLSMRAVMTELEGAKQSEYIAFQAQVSACMEEILEEDEIYRSEKTFRRTHNDNMLINMKGISSYSSTENLEILKFVKDLGMNHEWMYAFYTDDVPASADSLLGVKYILSDSDVDKAEYVLENEEKGYRIYRNPYVLPLIMPAEGVLQDVSGANGFEKMNLYWKSLTCIPGKNIFEEKEISECEETLSEEAVMKFSADNKNGMPLYLFVPYGKYIVAEAEGEKVYDLGYDNERFVYYLGKAPKIEISICSENGDAIPKDQIRIYAENESVLEEYSNIINAGNIKLEMISSSHLEGQYTSDKKEQYLVTTIPYDTGWQVIVDGEKAGLEKNWNTMLAFRVNEGKHTITMKYVPEGFRNGCLITVFSIVLATVYLYSLKRRNGNGL